MRNAPRDMIPCCMEENSKDKKHQDRDTNSEVDGQESSRDKSSAGEVVE